MGPLRRITSTEPERMAGGCSTAVASPIRNRNRNRKTSPMAISVPRMLASSEERNRMADFQPLVKNIV